MAVRASDQYTLQVLPAPTYVRTYYLLQSSSLASPPPPTTNPPPSGSGWTTTEPGYTAGETNTLYTVQLVAYGSAAFEYGEVQKSSAYEAAKQAYNIASQAKDAASTADGRLSVSASAPTAADAVGKPSGAVWFRRDGSNRFNGAWELVGTAWVARTIENAMIATLDAAKINTGFLDVANRVRANAISVQQLLVGSLTNLLEDPSFDVDAPTNGPLTTAWSNIHANVTRVTAGMRSGVAALRMKAGTGAFDGIRQKNAIHVEPGEEYLFSGWVRREGAASVTGAIEFSVLHGATAASTTATAAVAASPAGLSTTYVLVSGTWTVPAGTYFVRPRLVVRADTGNTNTYLIDDLSFQRRMSGELIIDGVVTAAKLNVDEIWANEAWLNVLRAGVVEVDMLAPGVGDSITAEVRGSFSIIAGQTAALQEGVAAVQDQVIDAQASVEAASESAAAALAGVDAATESIGGLRDAQAATQAQLETQRTYFWVDAAGAHIGRSDSAIQTHMLGDRFQITENGIPRMWITAGQMNVPSAVITELVLANHKIENYGDGTIVRAIN